MRMRDIVAVTFCLWCARIAVALTEVGQVGGRARTRPPDAHFENGGSIPTISIWMAISEPLGTCTAAQ
jgi:hypothetical protein